MSKKFMRCKNFMKRIGIRGGMTFGDYKKALHSLDKREKQRRKCFLKAKSMLSQGRKSVVIGNTLYHWGKDKKSVVALVPDFDGIRKVCSMLRESAEKQG